MLSPRRRNKAVACECACRQYYINDRNNNGEKQ